jgi:hypothetical protein
MRSGSRKATLRFYRKRGEYAAIPALKKEIEPAFSAQAVKHPAVRKLPSRQV